MTWPHDRRYNSSNPTVTKVLPLHLTLHKSSKPFIHDLTVQITTFIFYSKSLSRNRSPLNLSLTPMFCRSISHFIARNLNFSLRFLIPFSSFLSDSLSFSPLRSLLSVSILRLNLSFTRTLSFSLSLTFLLLPFPSLFSQRHLSLFSLLTAAENLFNSLPSSAPSDSAPTLLSLPYK